MISSHRSTHQRVSGTPDAAVLQHAPLVVENVHLRIELDPETGAITSLYNKGADLEAIDGTQIAGVPWRIQVADIVSEVFDRRPTLRGAVTGKTELVLHFMKEVIGGRWSSEFTEFRASLDRSFGTGTAIDLVWKRTDGITVSGRVELADDATDASFTVKVGNESGQTVLAVEYPIIDAIRPLGTDSVDNRLAHSVDGGFLFDDPHRLFKDPEIIEAWNRRKIIATTSPSGHPDEGRSHGGLFRVRGYPNGFEGAPMQFWAFYKEAVGGFYFACHDPSGTEKMFHFYVADDRDVLTSTVVHFSWDWTAGGDLEIDYPTVVGSLATGTWFEAAERYRQWATGSGPGHPDWCARGTLRSRVAAGTASRRLVEEVGFNTFGIPISFDVSAWYDAFHAIADKPVLHIVGHDWEGGAILIAPDKWKKLSDVLARHNPVPSLHEIADVIGIPATAENVDHLRDILFRFRMNLWDSFQVEPMEYLPPTFDEANVAAFDRNGDLLVPFLFRDFIGYGHDTEAHGTLAPITPFTNAFMCPTTEYWRRWHARTDVALVEAGVDGIYYDVSASCAAPTLCMNLRHDHPIGFGRHMIDAYAEVFRESHAQAQAARGSEFLPIGTEVIIENLIGVLDYAQCRAGAGVQATMEGEEWVEWQKQGRAHKIPMWSYVYHEYGPVLLDGWAKLSKRFGEIFYDIAARVALEGGLLQLNYEFSPLELFPGFVGSAYQLVYTNQIYEDTEPMHVDQAKVEFIREIAEARTGFAKDYLAYGRMIESLPIVGKVPDVTLDWDHFNSVHRLRLESGEYTTASVVQVGWKSDLGKLGYLFVNLLADDAQEVTVALDPSGASGVDGYSADLVSADRRSTLGSFADGEQLSIPLPPRKVVLLEVTPAAAPAG